MNEQLEEKGYIVLRRYIPQFIINRLYDYYNGNIKNFYHGDEGNNTKFITNAYVSDNNGVFTKLNKFYQYLTPRVEAVVGSKLRPTYNYGRVYTSDAYMIKHKDRMQCEISMSMCVAHNGEPWPIYYEDKYGNVEAVTLRVGDCVIYKGCEVNHWREPNKSNTLQMQHFWHWIDTCSEIGSYMNEFSDKELMESPELWPQWFDEMKYELPIPKV